MNIEDFKKALHDGEVSFTYIKKDGTHRKARGTLAESLTPAKKNTTKYKCFDIHWDVDDEWVMNLPPDHMVIEIDNDVLRELNEEQFEEMLADKISDKSGLCMLDFCWEKVEPKKLPEGTIFYYDLDKEGYRSFNESQLIDWVLSLQ